MNLRSSSARITLAAALLAVAGCKRSPPVSQRINSGSSQITGLAEEISPALARAPAAPRPPVVPEAPTAAPGYLQNATGGGSLGSLGRAGVAAARRPATRGAHGRTEGDVANLVLPSGFQPPAAVGSVNAAAPAPEVQRGGSGYGLGAPTGSSLTLPAIDPNGRFATTYRPGRGHLAGFEASLARGELPADARELVGDVGSRYAPEMAAPTTQALAWRVDLERAALPPSGGHTHLRIALRSSATPATARPPMSLHVVLDVSNSMAGDSIVSARRAAQELVERLQPNDHFSLVAFGANAAVRVPEGLVGPRKQEILDTIANLQLEGGTNISAGLDLGYAEAARGPQAPEWVKLVMLLSDGRPNAGDTDAEAIGARAARAFQTGVQTSSFGVGDDYDGNLMSGVASQGAGGYYYVRDPQGISQALATELESRLQPVAQAVEVRVRLRPDVRLTQTYGAHRLDVAEAAQVRAQELAVDDQTARRDRIARDRDRDNEGGMRFFIPGFARDDQHVILLGLDVPAGVGQRPFATVELRYKDRLSRRNVTDESAVRARYADSAAASAATADASVLRSVHGFDAGETMVRAARLVGDGAAAQASALLSERASLLRAASDILHEPRLAADASRVDRLRNLVGGSGTLSQPLALALLLNTSGQGMLH